MFFYQIVLVPMRPALDRLKRTLQLLMWMSPLTSMHWHPGANLKYSR